MADGYDRLPKVELHLHLEGAIPREALRELTLKYGGDPPDPPTGYRDLPHFIVAWLRRIRPLRAAEDFAFAAEAVARDLARQNVRYAEAFFSPGDFRRKGLDLLRIAESIRNGLSRVPGVEVALIVDLVRDLGPGLALETLDALDGARSLGVVGVGIGGSEQAFPPGPFAPAFEKARRMGLRTTAHAGEAAGAASVWGAIRALQVDRVGHATRAEEDPRLIDHLAERRIPLELCPLSNVRTKVVPSLREHPVRRWFDRGLLVTVNTDDPAMFGNSLAEEYRGLASEHGFTHGEIRRLVLNAVEVSWLSPEGKAAIRRRLESDPAWGAA